MAVDLSAAASSPGNQVDAADIAERNRERAMELFEKEHQERQARIRESMTPYDPTKPRDCVDCSRRISKKRLKAAICTGRCTACADAIERHRFV